MLVITLLYYFLHPLVLRKNFSVADTVPRHASSTCIWYNITNVEGSASPSSSRTSKLFHLKLYDNLRVYFYLKIVNLGLGSQHKF